jgi:hypothetical protein
MFRWFTRMPLAILLAIVLHLLIILSVLIAWKLNAFSAASESSSTSNEPVIQAQSVSQAAIDQQVNRLKQAHDTGSDLLVTACPKCQAHLTCAMEDPLRGKELEMEMMDLTGVIARTLTWE